ncbi:transposase [Glaciimonas sp. GG7]
MRHYIRSTPQRLTCVYGVSVGAVSICKSSNQIACLARSITSFIHITDGNIHELNILVIELCAYYLIDRGYLNFARLRKLHTMNAFFVTRAKINTKFKRRYSYPVNRTKSNVVSEQNDTFFYSSNDYHARLERVVVRDEAEKRNTFLTNNFFLKSEMITARYKQH